MADILQQIIATKRIEVRESQELVSIAELENRIKGRFMSNSLAESLLQKPGIIAEFKRASPSKGVINGTSMPKDVAMGYDSFGATAISVLTDASYFQAQPEDFSIVRKNTNKPVLRKEFIIDEYQIYESKQLGADVILLIAAVLTAKQINDFTVLAHQLNMEVLIELHSINELDKLCGNEDVIGVNNRNLKTFEVDIAQSILIKDELGNIKTPLISESGLSSITEIERLLSEGFSGFLMGEYFMKHKDPVSAFEEFMESFKSLTH